MSKLSHVNSKLKCVPGFCKKKFLNLQPVSAFQSVCLSASVTRIPKSTFPTRSFRSHLLHSKLVGLVQLHLLVQSHGDHHHPPPRKLKPVPHSFIHSLRTDWLKPLFFLFSCEFIIICRQVSTHTSTHTFTMLLGRKISIATTAAAAADETSRDEQQQGQDITIQLASSDEASASASKGRRRRSFSLPLFIKRKLTRLSHRVRVSGKSPSKAKEQAEGENQTTSKVP